MDPISVIVSAFVAGATAGLTGTVKNAVGDVYQLFKSTLEKRVASQEDASNALKELEKKPLSEGRQQIVKEELENLHIENETELLNLARTILEKLDEQGAKSEKYNIVIENAQGTIIGDKSKVNQYFNKRGTK